MDDTFGIRMIGHMAITQIQNVEGGNYSLRLNFN